MIFAKIVVFFLISCSSAAGYAAATDATQYLRARIEASGSPPRICVGNQCIYSSAVLHHFYERRGYQPAWSSEAGPAPVVSSLLHAIREARLEGLNPGDYHLDMILIMLRMIEGSQEPGQDIDRRLLMELDLLLTDAFLIYGSHLLAGRINPETIDPEWQANRREMDLAALLQKALESQRIQEALQSLLPVQPGYGRLKQALAQYQHVAAEGNWPIVPAGPNLRKGDRGERVASLRVRLTASGDLHGCLDTGHPSDFDDLLDQGVKRFQWRHGLDIDGVVGPATLAALNVPAQARARQIALNLERWRWLPQDLGTRYVVANIASFELQAIENNQEVFAMRVVVGRDYRRTPVFSGRITYLVLCPYWYIPTTIAVEDIAPLVCKNPDYLEQQKISVFKGKGPDAIDVDPHVIDWSHVSEETFAYRLRQDPGPQNPLGRIKFMFPNEYEVYLHDTSAKGLFARSNRAFSSGCLRIEKPLDLAVFLLQKSPCWDRETLLQALEEEREQIVTLPESIPVHLLYWTAWVDETGVVHFRHDVYGRDQLLEKALYATPPPIP